MASPGHGGRAAPAMVLLVWLIASAPLCAGGRTIGTAEHVAGVQPWHELVARAIASGRLPEWDDASGLRSEEHTSELHSRENLVCRLLLEKKKRRDTATSG